VPKRRAGRRPGVETWLLLAVILLIGLVIFTRWFAHPRAVGVDVYFVRYDPVHHTGALAAVRRPAPPGPLEARLTAAMRGLLAGPSPEERRAGIASEIPAGTGLRGVRVAPGTVTVDLTSTFGRGGGSTSMLARVWQVVYTATQSPDAPAVQITLDGRRVEALGGEGVMIGAPLERRAVPPSF